MMFRVVPSDRPHTLRLDGELDMATAPDLLEAVEPFLRQHGDLLDDLRLELELLSFADSTGLRAFFTIASRLQRGRLVLVDPSDTILRVLELTGLHEASGISIETGGD